MIKLLIVFLNIIANNFFSNLNDTEILITPNDEISEEIYEIKGEFKVYREKEKYVIVSDDFEIETFFYSDIIRFEDKVFLSYWEEEKLYINVYDIAGKLIERINDLNFNALEKHEMIIYNDKLFLIATSYNEKEPKREDLLLYNIMIYDVIKREQNIYGGILDEEFLDVEVNDEMYICLSKGILTYGDFGNGGKKEKNLTIAKIDSNLNIICYNVLNVDFDENVKVKVIDKIYLVTINKVFMCDLNFKLLSSLNYDGMIFVGKNFIIVFKDNKISLYSLETLKLYNEITYEFDDVSISIMEEEVILYKNTYYSFDIIDFRFMKKDDDSYYENENIDNVYSLYGNVEMISKEYSDYFDKGVFGEYNYEISYKNSKGISFIVAGVDEIKLEVNVVSNMIYPKGYRLAFNGDGVLDGKTIVNNYPIEMIGKHNLVIYGNNIQKEIVFEIGDSALEYSDVIYDEYDLKVNVDENFKMELTFDKIIEDIEISNIICDWEMVEFKYDRGKLDIVFKGKEETGKYILYIERALYIYDGIEYEIFINKFYDVIVCFASGEINVGKMNEEFELKIEHIGDGKNLRGIEMLFESGTNSYNKKVLFESYNSEVDILNIPEGSYTVTIYLITYNLTGYIYNEIISMELDVKATANGFMNVEKYEEDGFQRIDLKLNEKQISNIKTISYNEVKIYDNERLNIFLILIVMVVFLVMGIFIGQFVNKKYFNKTK